MSKDQRKSTRACADAARPQTKTAARKAFEYWWGAEDLLSAAPWIIWQAAWRAARGAKPTTREKEA